jgi:hypothetical protein
MKDARSTIAPENLQEVLDASASAGQALIGGQQQYITPDWLAEKCQARFDYPATALDPQVGRGSLLNPVRWSNRFGVDIDNRGLLKEETNIRLITGNCVRVFELLDELYPKLRFAQVNCNPPFGLKFKTADGPMDSTLWTWRTALKRGNQGYFIANHNTLVELGINDHAWVFHYEKHPANTIWAGLRDTLQIGIAFWKRQEDRTIGHSTDCATEAWTRIGDILDEEKQARPKFNIYMGKDGNLRTYLSRFTETKLKLGKPQIDRLHKLNGCHPLTLTTDKETRTLLREMVTSNIYTLQPEAKLAIEKALAEVASIHVPIMPVTDFETVAYADEEDTLLCRKTTDRFTAGRRYEIHTGSYNFTDEFKRTKVHLDSESNTTFSAIHTCTLSGTDRYIRVTDDNGAHVRFMDRPAKDSPNDMDEAALWSIFEKPVVKTIAETQPAAIAKNLAVLRSCEMLAGYDYYPGQVEYLARMAVKDYGLIAAATGTGKTLMAISLLAMKGPQRALIVAPQGTMRSSEVEDEDGEVELSASQWIQEINRFAPYLQVWELFSYEDYQRICALNGGTLPPGVYVSYYQAMFLNGGRESIPESWTDEKLNKAAVAMGLHPIPLSPEEDRRHWCDSIGTEKNGIRCILEPCLSTKIGHLFDMVALDEAHLCTNLDALVSQMLIRLQPQFRYAFTATPIPNIVSNLFSLMGWLAVPQWYKGHNRNASWPYTRHELGRFNSTFLSEERDITQEDMNRQSDPKWRGRCIKSSPVISAPARLLKMLKTTMAYISKEHCSPAYKAPKVVDVRVPLGQAQAKLYGHYLNRANVPGNHPLVRARRQTQWLRNITADPAGFEHGGPKVGSNMNPKVIAVLELTRDILSQGEQVVIINSRLGITNTIEQRLVAAGVPVARIDSTVSPEQHSYQANLFKDGKARVCLMGIKCAASHSFSQCRFEIISSIEYSPGPFDQAKGRVDRVNSRSGTTIYCILHKDSIEEVMFDVVATKDDAATICLKGRRVPRDFKPVDAGEVLAKALDRFDLTGATPEQECEAKWPKLRDAITKALESASPPN